ncbi:MAG TPA: sulfatase-like hydrolase/transferase [Geminicoccaceae bacterium]|nr:sulfatase-like hydrolase/transferase [Geminicoccaceae bacterium]
MPYTDVGFGYQPRPKAAFAGMITLLDRSVGRLVALLRRLGIEHDTLVLFTSDNGAGDGYMTNADFFDATGGLRGHKGNLYEGGIRVPMIAWWPGAIAPGETDHVVAQWDLMPTLAELVGTEPIATDGLSLVPLLRGRPQPEHDYLYWEQHGITTAQAVRFGQWKALRAAPDASIEVYDLLGNEAESIDLAASRPDLVQAAIAYMEEAHEPSPAWPLVGQSLWSSILEAKSRLGAWAREGRAHGRWYGIVATAYDHLTSDWKATAAASVPVAPSPRDGMAYGAASPATPR